jgi:hypothetical protein
MKTRTSERNRRNLMKLVAKIAIATVAVAAVAAPAMAAEWAYHGGPKSPDSMSWYQPVAEDGYYGDDYYAPNAVPAPYDEDDGD